LHWPSYLFCRSLFWYCLALFYFNEFLYSMCSFSVGLFYCYNIFCCIEYIYIYKEVISSGEGGPCITLCFKRNRRVGHWNWTNIMLNTANQNTSWSTVLEKLTVFPTRILYTLLFVCTTYTVNLIARTL